MIFTHISTSRAPIIDILYHMEPRYFSSSFAKCNWNGLLEFYCESTANNSWDNNNMSSLSANECNVPTYNNNINNYYYCSHTILWYSLGIQWIKSKYFINTLSDGHWLKSRRRWVFFVFFFSEILKFFSYNVGVGVCIYIREW